MKYSDKKKDGTLIAPSDLWDNDVNELPAVVNDRLREALYIKGMLREIGPVPDDFETHKLYLRAWWLNNSLYYSSKFDMMNIDFDSVLSSEEYQKAFNNSINQSSNESADESSNKANATTDSTTSSESHDTVADSNESKSKTDNTIATTTTSTANDHGATHTLTTPSNVTSKQETTTPTVTVTDDVDAFTDTHTPSDVTTANTSSYGEQSSENTPSTTNTTTKDGNMPMDTDPVVTPNYNGISEVTNEATTGKSKSNAYTDSNESTVKNTPATDEHGKQHSISKTESGTGTSTATMEIVGDEETRADAVHDESKTSTSVDGPNTSDTTASATHNSENNGTGSSTAKSENVNDAYIKDMTKAFNLAMNDQRATTYRTTTGLNVPLVQLRQLALSSFSNVEAEIINELLGNYFLRVARFWRQV